MYFIKFIHNNYNIQSLNMSLEIEVSKSEMKEFKESTIDDDLESVSSEETLTQSMVDVSEEDEGLYNDITVEEKPSGDGCEEIESDEGEFDYIPIFNERTIKEMLLPYSSWTEYLTNSRAILPSITFDDKSDYDLDMRGWRQFPLAPILAEKCSGIYFFLQTLSGKKLLVDGPTWVPVSWLVCTFANVIEEADTRDISVVSNEKLQRLWDERIIGPDNDRRRKEDSKARSRLTRREEHSEHHRSGKSRRERERRSSAVQEINRRHHKRYDSDDKPWGLKREDAIYQHRAGSSHGRRHHPY